MGAGQGMETTGKKPWKDACEKGRPTEGLADVKDVAAYAFKYAAIRTWLPYTSLFANTFNR